MSLKLFKNLFNIEFYSFLRIAKVLLYKRSIQASKFLFFQLRLDIINLDDDMLLTQIGYFGHHVEKAIKHQKKGKRGLDKRNRLFNLLTEANKRKINEKSILDWATNILSHFDNYKEIYIDRTFTVNKAQHKDEILSFMRNRTSVRFWQDKKLSNELIEEIINTAFISSALSCNRQTVRVVCVKNDKYAEGDSNNKSLQEKAPHLLYLANDDRFFTDKFETSLDIGSFASSIMLAASACGAAGCWMYEGKFHNDDQLREKLGLSKDFYIYSLIAIGYPLDVQVKPPRVSVGRILKFHEL